MEKIYVDIDDIKFIHEALVKHFDDSSQQLVKEIEKDSPYLNSSMFWSQKRDPEHKRNKIVLKKCKDADKLEEKLEKESRDAEILAKALMCHKACDYKKIQPIKYVGHESYDL